MDEGVNTIALWHAAYENGLKLQRDNVYGLLGAYFDVSEIKICRYHTGDWTPPYHMTALRMLAGPYGDVWLKAKLRLLGYAPRYDDNVKEDRWVKADG